MNTDHPLTAIVGQTVVETLTGPMDMVEGPELTGICTSKWYYFDLIVRLSQGSVLCLSQGDYVLSRDVPADASPYPLTTDGGETCVGKRVLDLIRWADGGAPSLYLLLEGGFYIENASLPGGSVPICGNLREWSPEELRDKAISLISGQVKTWESFADGPRGS